MKNTHTTPLEPSKGWSVESLLGLDEQNDSELIAAIARGLPVGTLETFASNSGLAIEGLTRALNLHPAKLARRKGKGKLTRAESDHLVSVTHTFACAIDLFNGNRKSAANWFITPSPALGDIKPLQLVKTHAGCRAIECLIGRLQHGVFS